MPVNLPDDDQFIYVTKGDFKKAQNINFYMGILGGFAIGFIICAILVANDHTWLITW